jgi:hypothetical protein
MSDIVNSIAMIESDSKLKEARITRTWIGDRKKGLSLLMVIPIEFARQYHIEDKTNLLLIPKDNGILMKKLELKEE